MNDKQFLKEHPLLKKKRLISDGDEDGYEWYRKECDNWLDDTSPIGCYTKEDIHETQIDKQKVKKTIDKIRTKLENIKENLNEKKLKEIENFGNSQKIDREKGYMRWAFEDGAVEALIDLEKGLGL